MFHRMPLILLGLIVFVMLSGDSLPLSIQQTLFAMSLTIKSFILFLLPLVIFGLLFKAAVSMAKYAGGMIGLILVAVCSSNFIAAFTSHYIGSVVYHFDLAISLPRVSHALQPAWSWQLPTLLANDKAMLAAVITGILFNLINAGQAIKLSNILDQVVTKVLNVFVLMIPFFVVGYLIKLHADGLMLTILKDYSLIFIVVAVAQFGYITLVYLLASQGQLRECGQYIKNMLPAALSGFSTMSSAATMPLTILGVERNAKHKSLAASIVPATANIHLLGDCIAIPVFAYAVLKSFGMPEPSLMTYLVFTVYFVIAKFSVAGVPGGGILVMLPILASYLGFDSAMLSLITALYVLFDPVITAANIFGNGALAKIIDRSSHLVIKDTACPAETA